MSDWLNPSTLDRVEERRTDPAWVEALWAQPASLVLTVGDAAVAVAPEGGLDPRPTSGRFDPERHFLLGLVGGRAWFAQGGEHGLTSLRSIMDGLAAADLQVAFTGVGLATWHATSAFCPRCGSATRVVSGGQARLCEVCGREQYPRTDPAVIVAILDGDDRLLLGRQPSWAPGRVSVFAGFVEVGESLEQAVHREMAEEVALDLGKVTYLGSQPWPFPRSLMVGFSARALGTAFTAAEGEIETARWFDVPELRSAMASGEIVLPPHTSIARRMIEAWLAGTLTTPSPRT
ncbi:NAD(+) diphosphatase [Propionicimonas sp.]|uniref:NAD(+) diphosphatase n=1 Tax=Propionicimonas sp. TaxID=1955623 RepID=UPI0039E218C2